METTFTTVAAGLTMRNFRRLDGITPRGKEAVENFWEYAAFIANSMVFSLIGVRQKNEPFLAIRAPIMIAVGVVLAARAVAVYSCCALFGASQLAVPNHQKTVLIWGGLRGALALALALGLPRSLPLRNEIVTVSFGVVAFSIFVQGLTIRPLLRRLGEIPGKAEAHEQEEKRQERGSPVQE